MTFGQNGAFLPSSSSRARMMSLTNGRPSLGVLATPSFPCPCLRTRVVTRRSLYKSSKMPGGSSRNPPNWRLWHPNNGVVFQQPLYPILDFARFFTETPTNRDTIAAETENSSRMESTTTLEEGFVTQHFDQETITHEQRTISTTGEAMQASLVHEDRKTLEEFHQQDAAVDDQAVMAEDQDDINEEDGAITPPFTPLDYKLQHEAFQTAKAAPEGSAERFWSYSFYRGPNQEDDVQGKVRVHYCRNAHSAERALQYFLEEKAIGLDLEWLVDAGRYSGARGNVSLVQIASQSRVILLHLALYPSKDELATPTLRKILEDPNITKLGVWIKGDCTRIKKWLGIETRSMFELSHLFKQVKYCSSGQHEMINKRLVSLASQIEEVMGLPMFKEQTVRTSDWTQPLNIAQIGYSASDAYAAVQLFAMLNHQREQLDPMPALPFHADLGKPIPLPHGIEVPSTVAVKSEAVLEATGEKDELDALRTEALEDGQDALLQDVVAQDEGDRPSTKATSKASKKKATAEKAPNLPKDPRVEAANAWLAEYREKASEGKKARAGAGAPALRAYHIWHSNPDMDLEAVARILRDPPLSKTTVFHYILAALHFEKLPYDVARLKAEIGTTRSLPAPVRKMHWPFLKPFLGTSGLNIS